jgi:hypothetical protein
MFTLSFPVLLPPDRSFFIDERAAVPPLNGKLDLSCGEHGEQSPLVLQVSGFPSEDEAKQFAPALASALRWASICCGYSISPSRDGVVSVSTKHFDGSIPTVFPTTSRATPYHTTTTMVRGEHLILLSRRLNEAFSLEVPATLQSDKALALAVELFSDVEFVGGINARFVVMFTALEVLVSSKSKRGAVVVLVKSSLSAAGREDAKIMGKTIDDFYVMRNDLVHEATSIDGPAYDQLRTIVQDVLSSRIKHSDAVAFSAT